MSDLICNCRACNRVERDTPCQARTTRVVKVETMPGSMDSKLARFAVCQRCYETSWADLDRNGDPLYEFILRPGPDWT